MAGQRDQNPYEGEYHLQATQHADCWTQHDAVLAIDTAGLEDDTPLVLDFFMQRLSGRNKSSGGRNMGKLLVSGDGAHWTQVGDASQLIDTNAELLTDLDNDERSISCRLWASMSIIVLTLTDMFADAASSWAVWSF